MKPVRPMKSETKPGAPMKSGGPAKRDAPAKPVAASRPEAPIKAGAPVAKPEAPASKPEAPKKAGAPEKHAAPKKANGASPESNVRVLKVGTCPQLSGKGTLGYKVGCTPNKEVMLRIYSNTGTGFFNDEWVAVNAIQQVFAKVPSDKTITSHVLYPLFRGKSQNTPAFVFAALKQEGLVEPSKDKQRRYACLDPKSFLAEVKALIASKVDLKVDSGAADLKGAPQGEQKAAKKAPSKSTKKSKAQNSPS